MLVCDPEGEYAPLVKLLHGQIIKLSPTSRDYLNPLDINLNYSEDENPLALKSDFVLSLCELIMGGKTGLEAIERTVIDRAVQRIYQPYFADPRPENMPILSDLHAALTAQHLPEAERVAQALDLYVSGSLNFFNNRTTVDIDNRFVCFDIKELPKNLKKPGMLVIQDQVWNRVTRNRNTGVSTWYYADEFHLLLKSRKPQHTVRRSGSDLENGAVCRRVRRRTSRICCPARKSKIFWKTQTLSVCSTKRRATAKFLLNV